MPAAFFDRIFIGSGKENVMRVLHYMFGIPPVRVGGLVRYATDLMKQELRIGLDVRLLIPGAIPMDAGKKTKVIKRRKTYMQIPVYLIDHPLPVPMCNGILDIKGYTEKCDGRAFRIFLQELRPDLIHIHTFMGLHREFLMQAQKMAVPVLFTTHDYFGICPAAVMLQHGRLCEDRLWKNCGGCCTNAFSKNRLWLEQSAIYRFVRKQDWIAALLKKVYNQKASFCRKKLHKDRTGVQKADYAVLRRYYVSMFSMVSWFHFNSTLSQKIYESRLEGIKGSVVNISHSGITDQRRRYNYGKVLRLGYFGSWSVHKGFFLLLEVCRSLYEEGCINLELHLYSDTDARKEAFVRNHPGFRTEQLDRIFCDIDALVVPSIWPETFGLVVLEAVSYGVPVIISEYTGAKDILPGYQKMEDIDGAVLQINSGSGFIYDGTYQGLKKILREIYDYRELLQHANNYIVDMDYHFSYEAHVQEMIKMYQIVTMSGPAVNSNKSSRRQV